MQPRTRIPTTVPILTPNIPLLEAGDLPGDDDWAFIGSIARDHGDDDLDVSFHPDFD